MKKLFALLALVLGVVSCQTEPEGFDVVVGGEQEVMLNVSLPEATRANSAEGFDFNNLNGHSIRYILEIAYNGKVVREVKTSEATTAIFPVRLAPNRDYTFTVWADLVKDGQNDLYYNVLTDAVDGSSALSNITLKEWTPNVEFRDAWTHTKTVKFTSGADLDMPLTRPFAKVRVVATDLEQVTDFGINPAKGKVVYGEVYSAFNAVAGNVVDNSNATNKTSIFSVADNRYTEQNGQLTVFADYIFVPTTANTQPTITFTLDVQEANGTSIKENAFSTPIPVSRNKVTSIVGNVLTQGDDINVNISNGFETPGHEVKIWDGESIVEPAYDENAKTYTINEPSQLAWLAAAVNGTLETRAIDADSFAGKTFKLEADIDLGGNEWTPISMSTDLANGKNFRGTFDGQGHTISGLYVNQPEVAGLFGYVYSATIKNVTVKNANIKSNHYAGGIVAWVLNNRGNIQVPFVMENCHVENSTIISTPGLVNGEWDNGDKVGGLVGYAEFGNPRNEGAVIKNCSVKDTSIKAYRDFAGLVGYASYVALENCTVNNVTLEQDLTHDYKAPNTPATFGMIIGRNAGGNTVDGQAYYYESIVDGVTKVAENIYMIDSANGLAWLANEVNKYSNYEHPFEGETIFLANDIDLGGEEWTPIGDYRFSANRFCGTFDGQNHTISNFKITKKTDKNDSNKSSYGFFGNLEGTVKNLTIANATVDSYAYTAALVGRLNNGLVENCHVVDCAVSNTYWQGGILIGQTNAEGTIEATVRNCSVRNSSITSKSAIGAISGPVTVTEGGKVSFEGCSVEGCTIAQNGSFGGSYDKYFGSMFGYTETDADSRIDIKNYSVTNTTVKDESNAPVSGDFDGNIYINECLIISSAEQLATAIKTGGNYELGADIAMTGAVAISNANFSLDGNGYTITMAENATNTYALFDITGGKATIKNITFDGVKEGAIVRTVGVEFNAENVVAKNGQHTQQQGLFRLMGKSTIKNCEFKNNTCNMAITLNYDGANNDPQVVENCVFEGNTCNATAVLYYVKGAGATVNGNKFIGNTVNCNTNGATVYMGFTENNVVTNNLFQNNTVNEANTSSRVAGGVFFGYETIFTGNAFVGNKVTGENAKGNDVCVSTYYTSIDLSGNYWGGNAPVEDTNYFVQHKSDERVVIINDYLTANPFN